MRVRDWMSPDPLTVEPSTQVAEARRLLGTYGVRHLPVVENGRVVGMVSDRDVRPPLVPQERSAADDEDGPGTAVVASLMSAPVHVIGLDDEVESAARLMLSRRISAVPVIDDGELVGLITTTDCLLASLAPANGSEPEP